MIETPNQMRMVNEETEARALEIWREREMQLPERVRRMRPDEIDYASGAWLSCILQAAREQ